MHTRPSPREKIWRVSPKEQERLKFKLITELLLANFPVSATRKIKEAKEFSSILDEVAMVASTVTPELRPLSKAANQFVIEIATPAINELRPGEIWAGARQGSWKMFNPNKSPDVIIQSLDDSCMSAVGEMLLRGAKTEAQFLEEIGHPANVELLAKALGKDWMGNGFSKRSFEEFMNRAPWGAMFLDPTYKYPHMVVVDGFSDNKLLLIRDPSHGFKYEMMIDEFIENTWNGYAVVKKFR